MAFSALFVIIVGTGMVGQWFVSFASKQIPELKTEPIRIWFLGNYYFRNNINFYIDGQLNLWSLIRSIEGLGKENLNVVTFS
jgi:hypothetical protein